MRLNSADEFDELVEIVDALAKLMERIIGKGEPVKELQTTAESIAARAHRLYQKRMRKN